MWAMVKAMPAVASTPCMRRQGSYGMRRGFLQNDVRATRTNARVAAQAACARQGAVIGFRSRRISGSATNRITG